MALVKMDGPELVEFGEQLRFLGEPAVLLDPWSLEAARAALGVRLGPDGLLLLRDELGFSHGWLLADALLRAFGWAAGPERVDACLRAAAVGGFFTSSQGELDGTGLLVSGSCEAQSRAGVAAPPCCWLLAGLLSGVVSRCTAGDRPVAEVSCAGSGHQTCLFRLEAPSSRLGALRATLLEVSRARAARPAPVSSIATLTSERWLRLGMVAASSTMSKVLEAAVRVAKVDATVLLTGESGTGKERLAELIHSSSDRAKGPFVAVNCGAVTETLLESELFGHARGAFTGATADRPGYFEAAGGGTLFLDEVGEVSPAMQVKLLRVLQEREVRRVGENRERPVDVRVIAATNRDLEQGLRDGSFREDLYYRLKVLDLHVPPLRMRREDVLPLARLFLRTMSQRMKRAVTGFSPQAADQLVRYQWPGNVRELENCVERAVAFASGERIGVEELPEAVREAVPEPALSGAPVRPLATIEREYILAVLARAGGNQTRAAAELGIGTVTLYRKLKAYKHRQ